MESMKPEFWNNKESFGTQATSPSRALLRFFFWGREEVLKKVGTLITLTSQKHQGGAHFPRQLLGSPVVPFYQLFFGEGSPTKTKGTLILTSLILSTGGPTKLSKRGALWGISAEQTLIFDECRVSNLPGDGLPAELAKNNLAGRGPHSLDP